jgi:hypothetical protein
MPFYYCIFILLTAKSTTSATNPGVIGACNMLYGFGVDSNGALICKRDSYGLIRSVHEVFNPI